MQRPSYCFFRFSLPLLLTCYIYLPLKGQYHVSGRVLFDNKPVPNASIIIKEDSSRVIKSFTISDNQGNFLINYAGTKKILLIEVNALGFVKAEKTIQVDTQKNISVNFILVPSEGLLPEVIIKSEPAIYQKGDTTIFKLDSFLTGNERSFSEALEKLPGFNISSTGNLIYNGKLVSRVLIESDDMLGKNYGEIVRKLGIQGIDKIEVLKKYTDPDNLSNISSNEQVINLKYKNNFIGRIFGEALSGVSIRNYNLAGQLLFLKSKLKIILAQETNTITSSIEDNMPQTAIYESINEAVLKAYTSLSTILEVRPPIFNKAFINQQFKSTTNLNARVKFSKKIVLIIKLRAANSNYTQNSKSISSYLISSIPFSITENFQINKKISSIDPSITLNYLPNKNNQLVVAVNTESKPYSHYNLADFQNVPLLENKKGANTQLSSKTTYNHLFKDNILTIENAILFLKSKGVYGQSQTTLSDFFGILNTPYSLSQNELLSASEWQTKIIYKTKNLIIKNNNWIEKTSIQTDLKFHTNTTEQKIGKDSLLNSTITEKGTSIGLLYKLIANKLVITPGIGISLNSIRKLNNTSRRVMTKNKTVFLPELTAEYKINKENHFTLTYSTSLNYQNPLSIAFGYYISNLSAISSGAESLALGKSCSANLFYSYSGLKKRGILLSTGLTLSSIPILTLNDIQPEFFYSYNKNQVFGKNTQIQSILLSGEKFTTSFIKRIAPKFNISRLQTYTLIDGAELKNILTSLLIGCKLYFRTSTTDLIIDNNYQALSQITNTGSKSNKVVKRWESSANFDWKLASRLRFSSIFTGNVIFSPNQSLQSLYLINMRLTLESKNKKWQWDILANNLTTKKEIKISSISPTQIQNSTFQLFPKVFLLQANFKF